MGASHGVYCITVTVNFPVQPTKRRDINVALEKVLTEFVVQHPGWFRPFVIDGFMIDWIECEPNSLHYKGSSDPAVKVDLSQLLDSGKGIYDKSQCLGSLLWNNCLCLIGIPTNRVIIQLSHTIHPGFELQTHLDKSDLLQKH